MAARTVLEELVVRIVGDATHYTRVMRQQFAGSTIAAASVASGAVAAFAASSVRAFSKFDDALQTSIAVMGSAGEKMKKALQGTVFDISSKSRTSPTDLALGYFHLASAGYKAADAIGAVGIVEKFAVAGAFDLNESGHAGGNSLYAMARSTNFLVDTLAALGLRTGETAKDLENMTKIGDVLTKANIISNATVQDFAKALTNKGAAAIRLLKKDMEEGVAVLAAFAAQGVKAENAGEKLYIITRDLARATLKHRDAWEELGIRVFDSTGNMRNLADVVGQMEKVMGKMSDEEKRATLMQLGLQDRSLAATIQLLGMSDAIRQYEKELRNASGSMKEVADVRLKSFNSQMLMLRNQVSAVSIGIGEILAPRILAMNERIKIAIQRWNEMNPAFRKWIILLSLGGVIAGTLIVSLGVIISSVGQMSSLFLKAGTTIMAFGSFIPYLAALAAVVAGIVYLVGGEKGLVAAWGYAKKAVGNFFTYSVGFLEHFSENMKMLWEWFQENWKNILSDGGQALKLLTVNTVHNMMVLGSTLIRLWAATLGWLVGRFEYAFMGGGLQKWAAQAYMWLINKTVDVAIMISKLFQKGFSGALSIGSDLVTRAKKFGKQLTTDIAGGAAAGADPEGKGLLKILGGIVGEGVAGMRSPLEGFKPTTSPLPKFLTEIGNAAEEAISPLEGAAKVIGKIHDGTDEPIVARFAVEGLEALDARSAKFIRKFMEYRSMMAGGLQPPPKKFSEMRAQRLEAFQGRTVGKGRQREISRRARMRSFLAKSLPGEVNPELPPDPEMEAEARLAGEAGLVGAGKGGGGPTSDLISAINVLTSAISANTETVKDRPSFEIEAVEL